MEDICFFLQFDMTVCGFFVWKHPNSSVGFSRFLFLIFFHLYSFSLGTFHSIEIFSLLPLLDFTSLNSNNKIHVLVTPWICIKFQSYWRVKSHAFVMFLSTEKLACFKIWVVFGSYFPVNMFLFKSLPQELFRSKYANSNKLIWTNNEFQNVPKWSEDLASY